MNQRATQMLFALLRSAISGSKLTDEEREGFSLELLPDLLKKASKHDVAHLVAFGIKKNGLCTKEDIALEKSIPMAIYRCEHLKYEYENLCGILEREQIPFLPLKGSVIRDYYPEGWMRTSCDMDILVHQEDLEKAKSILINEHGYTYQKEGSHEIVLFSPNKVVVELHHSLIEEGRANNSSEVLKDVWGSLVVRDGFNYWYEMPEELFYLYHIAHMAKHFMNGGCGIKPFIDLWVMEEKVSVNPKKVERLLKEAKLLNFYNAICDMVSVWFKNAPYNNETLVMEAFVLKGESFGTVNTASVMAAAVGESRLKSFLKLVFISRANLEKLYPRLEHYPILFPWYQVKRWFRVFDPNKRNKVRYLTEVRNAVTKDEITSTVELLNRLGLNK